MMKIKDSELAKKLYNKQFNEYSQARKNKVAIHSRKKIYQILGNIKNKRILFAGCGDGLECVPAVKKGAKVVGVDISEKMIEIARKNCPKADFYARDFEKTKFKNNSFDIVVSILAIMYKRNPVNVLKEFRRILKKNGFILLVVPHPVSKMIKYSEMNYFVKGKRWEVWEGTKRFNYYWLIEDYIDFFVKSRLKLVKLTELKPVKRTKKTPESELKFPYILIFKLVKD